jgi:3-oxoacyl-[acyl-carrier protein] reductase/pteridine reductase
LAAEGADVAITYLKSEHEAQETARAIEALGVRAIALACDVRSEDSVRAAVAATFEQFGGLNIVVNNAAVFERAPLDQLSVAAWDSVFETNVRGPFLVAREALPHLKATQGRIVNIGSLGGSHAWADHAHYCSSKAALHMLTQAMAKGFAPLVSVNCVAPGWVEMGKGGSAGERLAMRTPMGRNGTAEEVAQAVLFFVTGPSFITGQILGVDGGLGLV